MEILDSQPHQRPESIPSEKLLLVRNLFQYHYTHREGLDKEEEEKAIEAKGEAIHTWYSSEEGNRALLQYAESHTEEEIEEGKDLNLLIEAYESYKPVTLH